MNKIWKMSLHSYLNWLLNYRQLISLTFLVFIYQTVIVPLKNVSGALENAPLHITEPFTALSNTPLIASLLIIGYIILIIDLPNTSGNHTFIIWRTSRLQWILSQCLFTVMSAVTYFSAVFVFSALCVLPNCCFRNEWSYPAKILTSQSAADYLNSNNVSAYVGRDLIYSSNPWDSAVNSYFLMILSACLVAFILMFFSIKNLKIYGVILTVSITLIGFGCTFLVHSLQWLLPVPNSIYKLHFYEVMCIYKPLYSYIYLIAAGLVFIVLSCISVKKFSFSFSIEGQEGH